MRVDTVTYSARHIKEVNSFSLLSAGARFAWSKSDRFRTESGSQ